MCNSRQNSLLKDKQNNFVDLPEAQTLEHGASNTKVMGLIPREKKNW